MRLTSSLQHNEEQNQKRGEGDKKICFPLANFSPPPLENKFVHSAQCGQTNPLIFSTMPMMGSFAFRQNVASLLTSTNATPCGVVTYFEWEE